MTGSAVRAVGGMGYALIALGVFSYGLCEVRAGGQGGRCTQERYEAILALSGGSGTLLGLNTLNPALRGGNVSGPQLPPLPTDLPVIPIWERRRSEPGPDPDLPPRPDPDLIDPPPTPLEPVAIDDPDPAVGPEPAPRKPRARRAK